MRTFYLILVIFFLSLNLRPSITSVGPLLDIIQTDLGMSGAAASLITSVPVFCMGIFALLSIKLSKRLGIEKSLLIAMALIFIATLFRGFIGSSWVLISTSLFTGIGIGIAGPLIAGFIKKHFPDQLGVTSVYSVSMVIGASVATSFSIPLFQMFNESWQSALGFWSILAVIAALLLLPILIKQKEVNGTATTPTAPSLRITNKRVYLFMLFFGCMASIFYTITAWLAPFVQATGMTYSQSGVLLTVFTVIQIPISFLVPAIVARTGNRKMWLLICSFAELIGIVLLMGHFSPWAATVFLAIGAGGLFPLALLIPIEEAKSIDNATTWSAQMQFGGFLLGAVGPLFFGLTLDVFNSYTPSLAIILMTIIVMIFAIIMLEKNKSYETN
ncbi:CynX/NimT family MFS transporter [Lentibacillus saliphilus]|uniref:MFS transporter n=1 Tax=Lentibacillus saliphilus TaxID=2737028 RepID=UPI001C305732|nr:MFS transporter [Lentibacillus saliphilus]